MTATIPASGSAREALLQERTDQLCDEARLRLASHSEGAAECRELALMLGLVEADSSGSLVVANPWDADVDGSLPSSPEG